MKQRFGSVLAGALVTGLVTSVALPLELGADEPEATAAAPAVSAEAAAPLAPRFEGLGDHHHPISSRVPLVQEYFDQGLILAWGFNHAEAERSFRQAAALDPECAICWWGVAWVLGPNINSAMDPAAAAPAWEALETARSLAVHASAAERAYIEALGARYAAEPPEDRSALDLDFAEAMEAVARRFPKDLDAATIYAEALMDTMPWDYWQEDGTPKPALDTVLATLDSVIARDPSHPGANHFTIHAVEAVAPERGVAAADRLGSLVPGAGHLVHMPSHIYIRVGRYADAVAANLAATAADQSYITQCHAQGAYPLAYVPHNHHFLWAAASFAGQSAVAREAAQGVAAHTDHSMLHEPGLGTLQHYMVTPLYDAVRFGRWSDLLAAPEPAADLVYPRAVRHYARGMALARSGKPEEAEEELAALSGLAGDERLVEVTFWDLNGSQDILAIAAEVLAGEIAAARGAWEEAIARLRHGVELEAALTYDEPPPWHMPVRHVLGAVLLAAGRAAEAEQVYREDLAIYQENGWSLAGLAESLAAQAKTEEAAAVRARLAAAWKDADIEPTGSRR